jgi:hypothetical protein
MTTRRHVFSGVRLAAIAGLLLAAGCAAPRGAYLSAPSSQATRALTLHVRNRGWSDVVVYAVDGTVPSRLGRVAALQEAVMTVRPVGMTTSPLRLAVRQSGSSRVQPIEPVWARPGQILELTLQQGPGMTELSVR